MSALAKNAAKLCEKGRKNFNDVHDSLKDEVREILKEDGYKIMKDGTVVKA